MNKLKSIPVLLIAVLASFLLFTVAHAKKGGGGGGGGKGPTAVLNGPWGAQPGEEITFSGAGSSSPNGFIRQYCFNFGDQSAIVCTSSQTTTHAYDYQGEYTVTLTVTDPDNKQDTTADTATIQYEVPGQEVDLTVTAIDGPGSGRRGDYYPITVTIENLDWAAAGSFQIAIYLSPNEIIGDGDDIKKMTIYVQSLPGKTSRTYETEILLSGSIALGDYYFGAIVDELEEIVESNEENNALRSTGTMTIRPQKRK